MTRARRGSVPTTSPSGIGRSRRLGPIGLRVCAGVLGLLCAGARLRAAPTVDETAGGPGEWGFRPADGTTVAVTPPGFSWRPQKGAVEYAVQVARTPDFAETVYGTDGIAWNVHCPSRVLEPGEWRWRFRWRDKQGNWSAWSRARAFAVAADARPMPLPSKVELLGRIPAGHPRLFVRPEQMADLRARAAGDLKPLFDKMQAGADKLLRHPPPTAEPPLYPKDMVKGSDPWRDIWWGNRVYVQKSLGQAAELGFTWLLGGKREHGELAKRILLECAAWDPKGATGYRYNDEAGMPYAYYFARTYSFVYPLLSESERALCRRVMTVRGDEMYRFLCPRHFWQPYSSHSNRAWHFLGELGIACHGDVPEADDWIWFAANVFANVYPVWCDDDGGWHEGTSYWASYIARFTWWADIMRAALKLNAYDKPYFSAVGYYPMYVAPPHTLSGGFGDCTPNRRASSNGPIMTVLACQAANPHWAWYVGALGGPRPADGYVGFVRGALPDVPARAPDDLPSSRLFRGTGLAVLNSNLADARENVQVHFKSSPFGSQSHGYEAQNAFLLYVFGERMFIRSGKRDSYGSEHHRKWMWNTKSVNCITVDGRGQREHSAAARGEIVAFKTTAEVDYVVGEAAPAYEGRLKRFTRRMLFVKPEAIVVWDTLRSPEPATFEWRLHACNAFQEVSPDAWVAEQGDAACRVEFLHPDALDIAQTDRFETPPRPRIKLVEHHLTAATREKQAAAEFVTVLRPYRKTAAPAGTSVFARLAGGYLVTIPMADGGVTRVLLNASPGGVVAAEGLRSRAEAAAFRFGGDGRQLSAFESVP